MSTTLEEGKYLIQDQDRSSTKPSTSSASFSASPATDSADHNDGEDYSILSKTPLYSFAYPMAGMFLWLEARFSSHPLFSNPSISHSKLSQAFWVFCTTPSYRVLISPGTMFSTSPKLVEERGWAYFRVCFAAIDEDKVKSMSENLVKAFKDFWTIDDPKKIDDLLREDEDVIMERLAEVQVRCFFSFSSPL